MPLPAVVSKLTGVSPNIETSEVTLNSPSIVKLSVSREEISLLARVNQDLIVTLRSGETITIKSFYVGKGDEGNGDGGSAPTIPTVPIITSVTDNQAPITGPVNQQTSTNHNTPELQGTGPAKATLHIFDNGTEIGQVTIDANGNWTFTPSSPTCRRYSPVYGQRIKQCGQQRNFGQLGHYHRYNPTCRRNNFFSESGRHHGDG